MRRQAVRAVELFGKSKHWRAAVACGFACVLALVLAACTKVADVPLYVVLPESGVPGVPDVFTGVNSLRLSVRAGTPGGADMKTFASKVFPFEAGKPMVLSLHGLTGGHQRYVVLEGLAETADEIAAGHPATVLARGISAPGDYLAPGQNEPTGKRYPSTTLFFGRLGAFEPVRASMSDARAFFATADLGKGRYALAGGVGWDSANGRAISLPSVEIFDSANGFGFERAPADLASPRAFAAVAPLPTGGALLAGGVANPADGEAALDTAEFLDANGTPTGTTPKILARTFASASTFRSNGVENVLVAGGSPTLDVTMCDNELQELAADHFVSDLQSLDAKRAAFTATELADGRVLFAGGYAKVTVFGGGETVGATATAEILDTSAPPYHRDATPMSAKRWGHTATRLLDGSVFLDGGADADPDAAGLAPATGAYDVFQPASNDFRTPGAVTDTPRAHAAASLLTTGDVLLTGGATTAGAFVAGSNGGLAIGCAAIYRPTEDTLFDAGSMIIPRYGHASVVLPGGQVLVLGGYGPSGRPEATAEVFTPCWSDAECAAVGRDRVPPPAVCPSTSTRTP